MQAERKGTKEGAVRSGVALIVVGGEGGRTRGRSR